MKFEKVFKYYQQNKITRKVNEPILCAHQCTLHYAHAHVRCSECNCTIIMHAPYFRIFWVSWIHIGCSMRRVYELSTLTPLLLVTKSCFNLWQITDNQKLWQTTRNGCLWDSHYIFLNSYSGQKGMLIVAQHQSMVLNPWARFFNWLYCSSPPKLVDT